MFEFTSVDPALLQGDFGEMPRYHIFVEFVDEPSSSLADGEMLASSFDANLSQLSPVYQSFREKGSIEPPMIHIVRKGTFEQIRQHIIESGTGATQVKIPRVVRVLEHITFLQDGRL